MKKYIILILICALGGLMVVPGAYSAWNEDLLITGEVTIKAQAREDRKAGVTKVETSSLPAEVLTTPPPETANPGVPPEQASKEGQESGGTIEGETVVHSSEDTGATGVEEKGEDRMSEAPETAGDRDTADHTAEGV